MTTVPFRSKRSAATFVDHLRSDKHAPMSAMIEIADRCNEVCVHCYQVQGQKGEMTTAEVKHVIDELAEMGVLFLTISGGEPTLRKDFIEIVEHARRKRFAVKIFTNALTMTPELARRLSELAVQEVQISLYSHRADLHERVTRVPGSHAKTVAGARALIEAGVAVVLKTPLMSLNAGDHEDYVEFVSALGADYMMDPGIEPREDGDLGTTDLRLDDEQTLEVERAQGAPRAPLGEAPEAPLDKRLCGACSGHVHVEPNGELRPCTMLTVPVGHALEEGVRRAWENNENGRVIRDLTWAEMHGCRDCDLRAWCHRCFARAQVEGGDAFGPYAEACRAARLGHELGEGVAPEILAEDGRDRAVGPYRRVGPGRYRTFDDRRTREDDALAARHGWIRPGHASSQPAAGNASGLVQLRTPAPGRRAGRPKTPAQSGFRGPEDAPPVVRTEE